MMHGLSGALEQRRSRLPHSESQAILQRNSEGYDFLATFLNHCAS